ncbi:unnamed protein product [Clonostachys rosea]|uniref:FAD/NAD(P)-binding domain-containing protein n=1 Tax=Bionectria ochroleuca TaxID=29856 RepID=A0ABY6TSF4_BIOOC|nr:unnamed protein product [Clonostachys rosea]
MGSLNRDNRAPGIPRYDIIVVGGGFGGCYALWKFRKLGFSVHVFEAGSELGGVWHWNSYPGARVDSEMPYYQFTIPEVWRDWSWSQRFPDHAEIKAYFRHVDKILDLSKDVSYQSIVNGADFDSDSGLWTITTSSGEIATCKWFVPASGSSHKAYSPNFPGLNSYEGQVIHSSSWPKATVDFKHKRVAIIGAGATGVQLVQKVSKVAGNLSVYIRNPNIALPMGQRDISPLEQRSQKGIYRGLFQLARDTNAGLACDAQSVAGADVSPQERERFWEELWSRGGFSFQAGNYTDVLSNEETSKQVYQFWVSKVRQRVRDPAKQEIVAPRVQPYPFATKRSSLEQDYYECLDRGNVDIIGLKRTPIREFSRDGIITDDGKERKHDIVIMATGYDNMTGSLTSMGLRGKDGVDMKKRWEDGVWSYLGIFARGCPNMFMIYGPQAPTAFTNAPIFIEDQVEIVAGLLSKLKEEEIHTIEPRRAAELQWKTLCQDISDSLLFRLNDSSWYLGANIPGKKREQLNYLGGMIGYRAACKDGLKDWSKFEVSRREGGTWPLARSSAPRARI